MVGSVIVVENVSKRYLLQHTRGIQSYRRYMALRDVPGQVVRNLAKRAACAARGRQLHSGITEEFWALHDVSFEVREGEVIGIIGRNGAGKSTILKILSRITAPTSGRVMLRGRVGSLLEVGTGFHPELTGSENIYLNGAILGMSRAEIRRKFDEIVAFAEVEKFLDTPVKHYSSGMYVRLAFGVAAHLEPEILLIDEILAVGDAEFQKKCLGRIGEVARDNRTILFVSHNMGAISSLTRNCILLDRGRIVDFGDTASVVRKYLSNALADKAAARGAGDLETFRIFKTEDPQALISDISINTEKPDLAILPQVAFGSALCVGVHLDVYRTMMAADIGIVIANASGCKVTELARSDYGPGFLLEPGTYTVNVKVGDLPLAPGRYSVDAWVVPTLGVDMACDAIAEYPLFSIVKEDHIDHYNPPIPWGAVHCRAVDWDLQRT